MLHRPLVVEHVLGWICGWIFLCLVEVCRCLERQVRIDGAGTISDEAGEVMVLSGFASFGYDACAHADAGADECMMYGGYGQKHGYGSVILVNAAVAEYQNLTAF
jgi:hypothetical protein